MMVVWLLVWRYVFLCVYITLADWLLVLAQKVGGGGGGGGQNMLLKIVWGPAPPGSDAYEQKQELIRIKGVAAQMTTFEFYFGASLAHLLLRHTDNWSRILQHRDMSAAAGQHVAKSVVTTLQILQMILDFHYFGN